MNKYQREKVKRLKKLEDLGVNYYARKMVLRKYDLDKVDIIIDEIVKYKNVGTESKSIFSRTRTFFKNMK